MPLTLLGGSRKPYPAPLDRWSLMTLPWHFQGLRAPIPQLANPAGGYYGWFEPALSWIEPSQRTLVYQTKDAAGDRLYGLSLSGAYLESGQTYAQYPGVDYTQGGLADLNAQIDEIILGALPGQPRGVRLFCAGDGQGSGPGYSNPVGRTYGWDWLMGYTPTLIQSLDFRTAYCQFYAGYDDIFYGWSRDQFAQWSALVRKLCPTAVVGLEHDIGHTPLGEGNADYQSGGALTDCDIISSEYNSDPYLTHDDAVWQVNGRLRYANQPYNRPPDQPSGDDPTPPAYFEDSPRGPRLHEMMEWSTYWDVRGGCTPEGIDADRGYLRTMSPNALCA